MDSMIDKSIEDAMTLRDYVQVLFRQKVVIIICFTVVLALAFLGLKLQPKTYEAGVKMLISAEKQLESPYYKETASIRNVEQTVTQSEIVVSDPVLSRVVSAQFLQNRPFDDERQFASSLRSKLIEADANFLQRQIASYTPSQKEAFLLRRAKDILKRNIKVTPIRDTNMFIISVRDYNPIAAAILANTVSRSYVIFDLEQQLSELKQKYGDRHPKVLYIRENIEKMRKYLNGQPIDNVDALGPASVKIIEQASVPRESTGTAKSITFVLALLMGLFLGVMLAFIFEYADQTIKVPRDIPRATGLPYLASVIRPRMFQKKRVDFSRKIGSYARSYLDLGDQLYLVWREKKIASVMVASTLKRENTADVVINLASALVRALKLRVLVIDADFRAPAVGEACKLPKGKTLLDYLENRAEFKDVIYPVPAGFSVIPASTTMVNPVLLFDLGRVKTLLDEARGSFDLVLVRSSWLRGHKDPAILAQHLDTVLVVVEEGKVRRQVISESLADVKARARNILGVLLTNRSFPIPRWLYNIL